MADEDPAEMADRPDFDGMSNRKPPEFEPLSFTLSALAEWRWANTRSPQGMPVIQTPSGYEFGIENDQLKIRAVLRRGELHAFVPTDPPQALDPALWDLDWAWQGLVRKAQFVGRTEDGTEFSFKPHVKTSEVNVLIERIMDPRSLVIPQPLALPELPVAKAQHADLSPKSRSGASALPPYLAFMIWVSRQLKLSARTQTYRRSDFRHWLQNQWPAELGAASGRKLGMMTTLLGYPEDEAGGRLAAQPSSIAAPRGRPMLSEIAVAQDDSHPPYLAFMITVWAAEHPAGRFSKKAFQEHLKGKWPEYLGQMSQEKIEAIAMFLGDPAHEKGGFLPASAIRIIEG